MLIKKIYNTYTPGTGSLILDRDGVINEETNKSHELSQIKIIEKTAKIIAEYNDNCIPVYIITNQSNIEKGLSNEENFTNIMNYISDELKKYNAHYDGYICCGSADNSNIYRKPNSQSFFELARITQIDLNKSCYVGDRETDIIAAHGANVKGYYVDNFDPENNDIFTEKSYGLSSNIWNWLVKAYFFWNKYGSNSYIFHDILDETNDFSPATDRVRIRSISRQTYVFSKYYSMGFPCIEQVYKGLDYILKNINNKDYDLYELSFMLLACSTAKLAGITDDGLHILIYNKIKPLKDDISYKINLYNDDDKCMNSIMHLFESLLSAWYAFGELTYLDNLRDIYKTLKIILSRDALLYEKYDKNLERKYSEIEPGHWYEWISLLESFKRATGTDNQNVIDLLYDSARSFDLGDRIWHQMERIKAESVLGCHMRYELNQYCKERFNTKGYWYEFPNKGGYKNIQGYIGATSFYHIMSCFSYLNTNSLI